MNLTIRKWRIDDKSDLAITPNSIKLMNTFTNGVSYSLINDIS